MPKENPNVMARTDVRREVGLDGQVMFVDDLPAPARSTSSRSFLFPETKRVALQSRPGEWAMIADYSSTDRASEAVATSAAALRKRYGPDGFAFAARSRCIYARFLPVGDRLPNE